jgi:hypothetical protein
MTYRKTPHLWRDASKLLSDDALASARQALDLAALADVAWRQPSVNEHLSKGTLDAAALRVSLRGTAFLTGFEQFLERSRAPGHGIERPRPADDHTIGEGEREMPVDRILIRPVAPHE